MVSPFGFDYAYAPLGYDKIGVIRFLFKCMIPHSDMEKRPTGKNVERFFIISFMLFNCVFYLRYAFDMNYKAIFVSNFFIGNYKTASIVLFAFNIDKYGYCRNCYAAAIGSNCLRACLITVCN